MRAAVERDGEFARLAFMAEVGLPDEFHAVAGITVTSETAEHLRGKTVRSDSQLGRRQTGDGRSTVVNWVCSTSAPSMPTAENTPDIGGTMTRRIPS